MTSDRALQLIRESLDGLHAAGLLEQRIDVSGDTVLMGTGTRLDSIGFVTFVTDLEDLLHRETGEEHFLVLTDIHEASRESAHLSAAALARYIARTTDAQAEAHG